MDLLSATNHWQSLIHSFNHISIYNNNISTNSSKKVFFFLRYWIFSNVVASVVMPIDPMLHIFCGLGSLLLEPFSKYFGMWWGLLIVSTLLSHFLISIYLISKPESGTFIGRWHLIEGSPCFKVRTITHMKFKNFLIFFFWITTKSFNYHRLSYIFQN